MEPFTGASAPETARREGRIAASPRARKLARDNGIALEAISGTGPGGRIEERDVQTHIDAL